MRLAERLYTQGLISYPRTETNIFPNNMNLRSLVEMQQNDGRWGGEYFMFAKTWRYVELNLKMFIFRIRHESITRRNSS